MQQLPGMLTICYVMYGLSLAAKYLVAIIDPLTMSLYVLEAKCRIKYFNIYKTYVCFPSADLICMYVTYLYCYTTVAG